MNISGKIGKAFLLGLIWLAFFAADATAVADEPRRVLPATEVRTLYPREWQVEYVRGVAFNWDLEHIFLIDQMQEVADHTQIVTITPFEDGISNVDIPFVMDDVINMTFDLHGRRLLLLNSARQELAYVSLGPDDILDPESLVQVDVSSWNVAEAQGLAIDNAGKVLYILDSNEHRIICIKLDGGSDFATGEVSTIDLSGDLSGLEPTLQGLAFLDPTRHLYIGDPANQLVYEVASSHQLVQTHSVARLALTEMGGMAFGPSADRTDPPEIAHLFIANSNLPAAIVNADGAQNRLDHKIYLPVIGATAAEVNSSGGNIAEAGQAVATTASVTAPQVLFGSLTEAALCEPDCPTVSWLLTRRVAASADDAEERTPMGDMSDLTSTDLELIREAKTDQLVGIRFQDLSIPSTAQIQYAAIEFVVDEAGSLPTDLIFQGEATDHAAAFTYDDYNISTRVRTDTTVSWQAIATWDLVDKKFRTPNLASIIAEIVQRPGWSPGNAIAFIVSGSGQRTAESYDGEAAAAPKLTIQYRVPAAPISAAVETMPVPNDMDAADDVAIWVHPTDPARSTVIGTDKRGGIAVYDLDGHELQYRPDGRINNVDLRAGFPFGDERVTLVAATNQSHNNIALYRVNPKTGFLVNVATRRITSAVPRITGICMYHSPVDSRYYAIVNDSTRGDVEQWELFDNGAGAVDAKLVRAFSVGYQTEGCVADDEYSDLYIASEDVGIWKYGAEPGDGTEHTMIDTVDANGHLTADVEGLAIYYGHDGAGYLIASSQGSNEFVIYVREGGNQYVTTFSIAAGAIDEVTRTDGIDVTNVALGPNFPLGLFVAQDDVNDGANQNFKLVRWDLIANATDTPLLVHPLSDTR